MTEAKSLDQLLAELKKLKLDLKMGKLKDTSKIKKVKKEIARYKTKL
jgi:ribosomal protein L29